MRNNAWIVLCTGMACIAIIEAAALIAHVDGVTLQGAIVTIAGLAAGTWGAQRATRGADPAPATPGDAGRAPRHSERFARGR